MYKSISSSQNPLVKQITLLQDKSRERRKQHLFIIEGKREITLAIESNYEIEALIICSEININIPSVIEAATNQKVDVSKEVYKKIAYRDSTEGILAIAKCKDHALADITSKLASSPLILVAEAPEKPGNIGALLRTADAANVDAVIIANPKTDIYNPNIIRSSVGCVFTNNIALGSTSEIIAFLNENKIKTYCAALSAAKTYSECDFTAATAIVVGTEADGLTPQWLASSKQNIIIPMAGKIDSMNVSVAAGILIFEAKRQRNFL